MKIRINNILFVLLSLYSCERKDTYILKSDIKQIAVRSSHSDIIKNYKIGKYKIDYSSKNFIKIFYSDEKPFIKPRIILLRKNDKYYSDFDLRNLNRLSPNSFLFLSNNPSDSYRHIEKISTSNLEPPPPYIDKNGRYYQNFDDSIVFKKNGKLTMMYLKDNNLGQIRPPVYFYDNNYRIKKIIEKFGNIQIIYK